MGWSWKTGTPRERADMVRSHRTLVTFEYLCNLFHLNRWGAFAILGGDDWRRQYDQEVDLSRIAEHYLGDTPVSYPERPGFTEPTTSKAAAEAVTESAEDLRTIVLESLRLSPATVHEMAKRLGRPVPSIQPRFSELRAQQKIEPSGVRRKNESGMSAHVWRTK